MPYFSNEDQFKFLISCIRHSNNGKVDFSQVAKECQIVSKGAAVADIFPGTSAKRYERMMRTHGIPSTVATTKPASGRSRKNEPGDSPAPKKRKGEEFSEDPNNSVDDDEPLASFKQEPINVKEELKVKEEDNPQEVANFTLETNAEFLSFMEDFPNYGYLDIEPTQQEYTYSPQPLHDEASSSSYRFSKPSGEPYMNQYITDSLQAPMAGCSSPLDVSYLQQMQYSLPKELAQQPPEISGRGEEWRST
ncbi:hypothetical protein BP5796_01095 [Coleophoma crateriformis]|uniref:Myb-like DNA-binding domain-containing protein n=1 Tax=Coleophoma crateriformis TaxID=565419 RepID=A0A3D8T9S1_9HELO|nr:hypothetical protein BP5796_01095 [Coleophoma crateriformis]